MTGFLGVRMEKLCDVPAAMRPSPLPGSARAGPSQILQPPQEGAIGSAEPHRQIPPPKAVPKVQKKPAKAPEVVGIAETPEPAGGPAPMDLSLIHI